MPIQYKFNIISALKKAGYSTYRLRKEKILGEATIQKLRNKELVSWENISTICELLNCQPGDIIMYLPDWVEDRVVELTELREEELRESYEDIWKMDDSFEEQLSLKYEDYVLKEIDRIEGDELDDSYIEALYQIIRKHKFSFIQDLKDEIKESYKELFPDIWEFFEPFIKTFNEEYEKEHMRFVDESVKNALEEEKADIEKQALEEYLSE